MSVMSIENFIKQEKDKNKKPYTPSVNEKLLTVSQYAKMVCRSTSTIRNMLRSGRLDGVKDGERWRVRIVDDSGNTVETITELKAENAALRQQLECIKAVLMVEA